MIAWGSFIVGCWPVYKVCDYSRSPFSFPSIPDLFTFLHLWTFFISYPSPYLPTSPRFYTQLEYLYLAFVILLIFDKILREVDGATGNGSVSVDDANATVTRVARRFIYPPPTGMSCQI